MNEIFILEKRANFEKSKTSLYKCEENKRQTAVLEKCCDFARFQNAVSSGNISKETKENLGKTAKRRNKR